MQFPLTVKIDTVSSQTLAVDFLQRTQKLVQEFIRLSKYPNTSFRAVQSADDILLSEICDKMLSVFFVVENVLSQRMSCLTSLSEIAPSQDESLEVN